MIVASLVMLWSMAGMAQETTSVGQLDLTLARAIDIALAENPTIKVADKEVELKKVSRKEAWMNLMPTLDVTLNLQNNIKVAEIVTSMGRFKMGVDGTLNGVGAATLSLPVFAPSIYQNIKLTKEDIQLAQEKARGSRLDLIREVTKAYYSALLAQNAYEVMLESYNISKQNYDVVAAKYDFGKVSEYDKISAEVQMRSMNSSLVSSKTGLTLALLQLKVLMGVTEDVDITINDKLENYEDQMLMPEIGQDAELDNNTALRQLDFNMTMLERSRKLLYTNFMPSIAVQLTGQYQSMSNNNWNVFKYHYSNSATLAISVNIPIFHATNFTKLKSNKLQLSQLEDTRINTRRQLSLAAESYRQNMASSIAQMTSNREAVNQANKAVTIMQKRYDVGHGTILEVNQSQVALTQSKLTYSQSIYDYLKNRADLDYTLGRDNSYVK